MTASAVCNPMRAFNGAAVRQFSSTSALLTVMAAETASVAVENAAAIPSPIRENTNPSFSAIAFSRSSSWRTIADFIAVGSCSHIRVEPSRSVNMKVTVPKGACVVMVLVLPHCDGTGKKLRVDVGQRV
jgi:hypothetical protein